MARDSSLAAKRFYRPILETLLGRGRIALDFAGAQCDEAFPCLLRAAPDTKYTLMRGLFCMPIDRQDRWNNFTLTTAIDICYVAPRLLLAHFSIA